MQPDILEILYEKYYHSSYLYILSLCRNKEVAEDIVSEAFEKAFITLDDSKSGFQYWLLVVCKNLWLDRMRKDKRLVYDAEDIIGQMNDGQTPESHLVSKEKSQIIYDGICRLSLKHKEILTLHYYAGISLAEIASIMHISPGNAKTLICRARAKLKIELEEHGYEF